MKIFCQVVVRNEADRFWSSWLDWHVRMFPDGVHVYDDQSTDNTARMAEQAGALVTRRIDGVGFLEHEGKFRQQAWGAFEDTMKPEPGSWVFCIDADEFLVSAEDETNKLFRVCEWAAQQRRQAYMVSIPEVFGSVELSNGELTDLSVRTDGWWGKIAGTRLFEYHPGGKFSDKVMGSGSEPTYVSSVARSSLQEMWLMHYGYARPADVQAKYARYSGLVHGHSDKHIQSIIEEPDLVPWDGPKVNVHFGLRPKPGPGRYVKIPIVAPGEEVLLTPDQIAGTDSMGTVLMEEADDPV